MSALWGKTDSQQSLIHRIQQDTRIIVETHTVTKQGVSDPRSEDLKLERNFFTQPAPVFLPGDSLCDPVCNHLTCASRRLSAVSRVDVRSEMKASLLMLVCGK